LAFKESKYTIKDNQQAAIFFGSGDENFHYLQEISDVDISARGADIYVAGPAELVDHTATYRRPDGCGRKRRPAESERYRLYG